MDITLARAFLAIADTGSFVHAAEPLHVTQSTISSRMKALEDLLGRSLLERSKAGARLTPAAADRWRRADPGEAHAAFRLPRLCGLSRGPGRGGL